jgi:glycerate-2-kinase
MGLGGVVGRISISSSEMLSVSGMYMMGSVPDGGALAGSVRAVKPGHSPASAPPWVVEGGEVSVVVLGVGAATWGTATGSV